MVLWFAPWVRHNEVVYVAGTGTLWYRGWTIVVTDNQSSVVEPHRRVRDRPARAGDVALRVHDVVEAAMPRCRDAG